MAKHVEASGSLALSRRPRDTARTLPRTMVGSPAFSAASVLPRRPAEPAEIAQARVFERLLQAECAELQELARRMAGDNITNRAWRFLAVRRADADTRSHRRNRWSAAGVARAVPHSVPDGDRYPA